MNLYELYEKISSKNPDKGIPHPEYRIGSRNSVRYFIPYWLELPNYSDVWVNCRVLEKILAGINLTFQYYYDLVLLGLSSPDERPECRRDGCHNKTEFINMTYGYRESCSRSCSRVGNSNASGHIVSEESKAIISEKVTELYKDPEYRRRNSETQKIVQNKPEVRLKHSIATIESNKKPEVIKKKRESRRRYLRDHPNSMPAPNRYKKGWYESDKFGRFFYRSSYERDFIKILESDSNVICLHKVPFIPYYNPVESRFRDYYPDFLIELSDKSIILVELKPDYQVSDKVVKAKAKAAKEYCKKLGYKYIILTELDLYKNPKSLEVKDDISLSSILNKIKL